MACVISPSLKEVPSPYPDFDMQEELAPGQELVIWRTLDGTPVRSEWQPQSSLRAIHEPDNDSASYHPDISFILGTPFLSAAVRDMIEALEPGVHQFFPVDTYNSDGTIREPRRYILNICQITDAIVERTYSVLNNGERLYRANSRNPVKIKHDLVSNLHVWIDKHTSDVTFVSDVLCRQMNSAGYTALDLGIAEEV